MNKFFRDTVLFLLTSVCWSSYVTAGAIHNLSVDIDTSVEFEDLVSSSPWSIDLYSATMITGAPFSLADGDTVSVDVTTTGAGVELTDIGNNGTAVEFLLDPTVSPGASWQIANNPTFQSVLSYDQTTTVTVSDYSGDYKGGSPFGFSFSRSETSPVFRMLGFGDFTDTTVLLKSFNITTTFTNFDYKPGFDSWASSNTLTDPGIVFFSLDDFAPQGVPGPASLLVLAFGFIGLLLGRDQRRTILV